MGTDAEAIVDGLRRMIAEEMHLLGQELEDSLTATESDRLDELAAELDRATELLVEHRATRPHG